MLHVTLQSRGGKRVEIGLDASGAPSDAPLVTAAELGFHPLGAAEGDADPNIGVFVGATRDAARGMYLGLFDSPTGKKFALVQDDRGGAHSSFYERHRPEPERAWRDWFYAAGYVLFSEIDARWHSTDVVLAHPTGHGWGPPQEPSLVDMPEAFLNGVAHAMDQSGTALARIWIDSCCRPPHRVLRRATARARPTASAVHRDIVVVEVQPDELSVPLPERCRVLRANVAR
jgi:hypothetical protein